MKIDILTLFPELVISFTKESIIKRAIEKGLVEINVINIRDYTPYKNGQVDDTPFGGGAGMVLMCEPVFNAVESVLDDDAFVILLTPSLNINFFNLFDGVGLFPEFVTKISTLPQL